jgi:hypothetical protein
MTGKFHGTNNICYSPKPDANPNNVDTEQTNIGKCSGSKSNDDIQSIEEVKEGTIERINGTYLCYL